MAPGDHRAGVPPVVSPRTSSNRNASHAASTGDRGERSRRAAYGNEQTDSPRGGSDGQQDRADRQRSNGNTQVNGADRSGDDAAAAASRARRRAAEPRATTSAAVAQTRYAMADDGTTSLQGLSREASEVLNRVVISKPEVDIEREQERMAEAVQSSPLSEISTPMGALSIDDSGRGDSARAGSRSRHDHTGSSGKREKSSKFGEYYLGGTLGEGEFGKVKMGWKQGSDVEVSCIVETILCGFTNNSLGRHQAHTP